MKLYIVGITPVILPKPAQRQQIGKDRENFRSTQTLISNLVTKDFLVKKIRKLESPSILHQSKETYTTTKDLFVKNQAKFLTIFAPIG